MLSFVGRNSQTIKESIRRKFWYMSTHYEDSYVYV